jgi:tetrahydromethanopterin S-methyltransferase subunit G
MPTSLPPSVREHFGEDVADDFARWLDETFQQRAVERDEYREVLSRLDVLEEGFNHMEKRFDLLKERVDAKLDQMNDRILSMTRWLIGLIALFGSLVTALLAGAQLGG